MWRKVLHPDKPTAEFMNTHRPLRVGVNCLLRILMNDDKARGVLFTGKERKKKRKKHYPAHGNVPAPELDRKQRSSRGETRLVSVGKREVFLIFSRGKPREH